MIYAAQRPGPSIFQYWAASGTRTALLQNASFSVKFGCFPWRRRASANEAGLPIACLASPL